MEFSSGIAIFYSLKKEDNCKFAIAQVDAEVGGRYARR